MEVAIFAAGCFWGVEAVFAQVTGVVEAEVGYLNGHTDNPTYEDVCTHTTGHAEAVRVTFDPTQVSYVKLLHVFFELHDPTQINRQGPDLGDQYRSGIFTLSSEQERSAHAIKFALNNSEKYKRPLTTIIEPAKFFWRAEDYHQHYFAKNGRGSCHI